MSTSKSVLLYASVSRTIPAPSDAPEGLAHVKTYVLRVKANDLPLGIPNDANPRDANLNRRVYKRVRSSLLGDDGPGSFHLKHGGIVLIADEVKRVAEDQFRVHFRDGAKQGIANGNHTYKLILQAQEQDVIPGDQYVEVKIHTGVPTEEVPDLADGLNTSMQVRDESLADLRNEFDWLKTVLDAHPAGAESVAWRENSEGAYEVREIIALLMALDPTRYPLEDPVGVENTYARLSTVFTAYLADQDRVQGFAGIAVEALELYELIRFSAASLWTGHFGKTLIAEKKTNGAAFTYPFLLDTDGRPKMNDVRLRKAAAIPCFAAFRVLVDVDANGVAAWRYPFEDVKELWTTHGAELLREVHEAVVKQHGGNVHYAGRSVMLYRATTKTVELADLRRRVK